MNSFCILYEQIYRCYFEARLILNESNSFPLIELAPNSWMKNNRYSCKLFKLCNRFEFFSIQLSESFCCYDYALSRYFDNLFILIENR